MGFFKKFFSNEERGKKEGADDEKHSKQRSPTKKPKKINRQLHRPRRAGPPRDRHRGRRHRRHLRADLAPAAARADDRDQPGRIFVFFSSLGRVLNEQKKRKLCSLSLSLHFFFFFFCTSNLSSLSGRRRRAPRRRPQVYVPRRGPEGHAGGRAAGQGLSVHLGRREDDGGRFVILSFFFFFFFFFRERER